MFFRVSELEALVNVFSSETSLVDDFTYGFMEKFSRENLASAVSCFYLIFLFFVRVSFLKQSL